MHAEAVDFITRMRLAYPAAFNDARHICEAGSLDINGSPRQFFAPNARYVGVDWRPGPGVDVVTLFEHYDPSSPFDFVVSTEMLEHDPYWHSSLQRMLSLVAHGGSLLITTAGPDRETHHVEVSPNGAYYGNLSLADLMWHVAWGMRESKMRFARVYAEDDAVAHDIRLFLFNRIT